MTLQCATLSEYVQLWLSFRDAALRAEIIQHRDDCPVCIALKEATVERRRGRTTTDIHSEIPIVFPEQVTERLAALMRRLYTIITPRAGDIGWVYPSDSASGGGSDGGIRIDSETWDMVGEATGEEII